MCKPIIKIYINYDLSVVMKTTLRLKHFFYRPLDIGVSLAQKMFFRAFLLACIMSAHVGSNAVIIALPLNLKNIFVSRLSFEYVDDDCRTQICFHRGTPC